jgi:hypothetical protein
MRSGCEILKCPDLSEEGRCLNQTDTVNRDTGEDMCPRNEKAIPRAEWGAIHGEPSGEELAAARPQMEPVKETVPDTGLTGSVDPSLKKDYLLTVRVRFKAREDHLARHVAQVVIPAFVGMAEYHTNGTIEKKLQRLSKSGPPVKVEL